jgi:hypothetical protein
MAGQDQGLALVARTDQRVEIVGQLRGEWAEADVVEGEQIDRAEAAEALTGGAVGAGGLEVEQDPGGRPLEGGG